MMVTWLLLKFLVLHFEGIYKGQQGTFTAIEQGIFDKGNLDSQEQLLKLPVT